MDEEIVTITARDFIGWAVSRWRKPETNFTSEELAAGKLVFNKSNGCWCLERETKGIIRDNMFYPLEGQSVKYTIAVSDKSHFKKQG